MSPITKLLSELHFKIPLEILEAVFVKRNHRWLNTPQDMDENIMSTVIRPRLLVDTNLMGGTEIFVALDGIPMQRINDFTLVYRIPKSRTQGRSIVSAKNITFTDPTRNSAYGTAAGQQNTTMLQVASAVMDAHGSIPITSTARVQLIGENVIMVRDTVVLPANVFLRCVVENDDTMSHIQLKSYRIFSMLGTLAVKAYIYNEYTVLLDIGALFGGQNLGRIKEIIDGYADAEDLYQTMLYEKWMKVALMNDQETWDRTLRTMIGGSR